MICDICGLETERRYALDLRRGIWCCPLCLHVYQRIWGYYSRKGYSKDRCISILRKVIERQKQRGKWRSKAVYNTESIDKWDDNREGQDREGFQDNPSKGG